MVKRSNEMVKGGRSGVAGKVVAEGPRVTQTIRGPRERPQGCLRLRGVDKRRLQPWWLIAVLQI